MKKNNTLKRHLLGVCIAASLASPTFGYNLYADNGHELNANLEAIVGTFQSQENYLFDTNTYAQLLAIVTF